jgi:triosephosphate isomerase
MEAVKDISKARIESIVVAYEPVWAVGTDKTPSSDEIMEAKIIIRKLFSQKYDKKTAEKVKIIYGGSVNANTVGEVVLDPAMDGALIGRESLVPYDFLKIVEIINE